MLHVFTDREVTLNGHSYPAGAEILAFIPGDLLPRLEDRADPNSHIYLVDGSANLFRAASQINEGGVYDGYYHKTLVFGERRGGRSYWALDVSSPDPSAWKVKWHIQGGSVGITTPVTQRIEELGYTWSKPFFTTLKIGDGLFKDVVIFAGGYDPDKEDGFPEAFADTDDDGIRDPDEFHAPTVGGTEGYDLYNPGTDIMGRGIFVVDLADGTLLFNATFAGGGNEVTTGTDQRYGAMKYCFPAELSVIPFSETELVIYAADIYGQIWKVHYRYNSDQEHNYSDPNSEKWTVKRIFAANPGSDMPSGDAVWFGDETLPSLVSADAGRKTFYPPDISYFGNEWTSKPVLYFGTGDRAHPHYRMIKNRFYVVADYDQMTDETGLLNLTCGELSENADANGNGGSDEDDARLQTTLAELLQNGSARGFFRILSDQGNCIDDNTDHTGEQVLSQPTLFFKNVYFTSYQHVLGVPCSPTGNAYIYALDYSYGAPVFNYNILNDTDFKIYDLSDSYLKISGSSIPSGVRIITRGEEAAGLISAGRSASGVGEEQKTKIPGPPGGVSQLLWETGE
jgi:type IV pilus assembly protein PilY1